MHTVHDTVSAPAVGIQDRLSSCLIGQSAVMREVRELVARAAASSRNVLIVGERGTGKTLVARLIHESSGGAPRPLVVVQADERGLAEVGAVHAGTIVLEDLHLATPSLRRRIERRLANNLAGEGTAPRIIVTASSFQPFSDATELVFAGAAVFPISLPALREHRADIPRLIEHFRQCRGDEPAIPNPDVVSILSREWTDGNVEELRAWVDTAASVPQDSPESQPERQAITTSLQLPQESVWTLAQLERHYIEHVLALSGGNQSRAAEKLGIDRRTLYRKLREYRTR